MECLSLVPSNSAKRKPTLIKESFPCAQGLAEQINSSGFSQHLQILAALRLRGAAGVGMDRGKGQGAPSSDRFGV